MLREQEGCRRQTAGESEEARRRCKTEPKRTLPCCVRSGSPSWMCGSCGESTGAGCGSCQGVGRQRRGPCARACSTHRTADRKGWVKLLRVAERASEPLELQRGVSQMHFEQGSVHEA